MNLGAHNSFEVHIPNCRCALYCTHSVEHVHMHAIFANTLQTCPHILHSTLWYTYLWKQEWFSHCSSAMYPKNYLQESAQVYPGCLQRSPFIGFDLSLLVPWWSTPPGYSFSAPWHLISWNSNLCFERASMIACRVIHVSRTLAMGAWLLY